jgi:phosphatidylserine/phosphatidylglycerophosphate/cardiolipin synthase-like enzyme
MWLEGPGSELLVRAEGGVSRALVSPVVGLVAAGLDGFLGMRETRVDGGVRAMVHMPYFGLGGGAEYNFLDNHVNFVVSATTPVRRGGIVRPGGMLRINWYPTESHGFTVGVSLPMGDPFVGRTRPRHDYVVVASDFAAPVPYHVSNPTLEDAIDSLAASAEWIRLVTVPFLDQDGRDTRTAEARAGASLAELRAHLARRGSEAEVRHFHTELVRAFTVATRGDEALARSLADSARRIVLSEVILPYNRLLGQKKRSDELVDLGTAARGRFSRAVVASGLPDEETTDRALYVFQRLTGILEELRVRAAAEWDDPRLVWLPLQLALLPEQHDSQAELDSLLERATSVQFSDSNAVQYLVNLDFHRELLRTIRETEDYHVLWIHDFPAVTSSGQLDWASLDQVVDGYLTTLAERLESYDSVRRLPMFFIFLDEHYYQARKSRIWMTILEDPLQVSSDVPEATPDQRARIAAALDRVRAAANGSKLFQAEARQYGDAWRHNRVKVHVNITNRPDPSFWSGGLVSSVFAYPDNVMRDHRKIVFRDVTESDPYHGEALYTGMGVGQQYLGPTWDDRSVKVRGPALIALKRSARDLLLSQGISERELPKPFRLTAPAAVTAAPAPTDSLRWNSRAIQLSNGTGYLPKPLNVGKALLYSLMPKGSVIKIPDSLWNSFLYGGLLVGACLRGADVSIVSPSRVNAPSAGGPTLARGWELMSRLLMARDSLSGVSREAGGSLELRLYTLPPDAHGFASRAQTWLDMVGQTTLLKGLLFYDIGDSEVAEAAARPGTPVSDPPKLHQKVQFLATPEFRSVVRSEVAREKERVDFQEFKGAYFRYRDATAIVENPADSAAALRYELGRIADRIYKSVRNVPGAAGYAIVGSQNQDYRGMFMDGEVAVVFSGPESLVPLLDLVFLEGTATLLQNRAQLDSLLPPPSEYLRRLSRILKDGL